MTLEEMSPVSPLHFFKVKGTIEKLQTHELDQKLSSCYALSDLSELLYEESFAKVYVGWHKKGLLFHVHVKEEFSDCFVKTFDKGDSFELFLDTRNLKTTYMNKYCHHFYFLPKARDGIQFEDITKLRQEDHRPLLSKNDIEMDVHFSLNSYKLLIFIKADSLYGFDPTQFNSLSMQYIVHRHKEPPQYFAFSKNPFKSMLNPSMWAEMQLKDSK